MGSPQVHMVLVLHLPSTWYVARLAIEGVEHVSTFRRCVPSVAFELWSTLSRIGTLSIQDRNNTFVSYTHYRASRSPPCLSVVGSSSDTPLSFALMIGPMVIFMKLKYSSMVNGTSFNHRNMSSTPYTGTSCLR